MLREEDGRRTHWHNGSAGTFYAVAAIDPAANIAVVVATNAGISATAAVDRVAELVSDTYRKKSGGTPR